MIAALVFLGIDLEFENDSALWVPRAQCYSCVFRPSPTEMAREGLTGPDLCSALSMLFVLQKVMPRYLFCTAHPPC